jgi:hypothetical protein
VVKVEGAGDGSVGGGLEGAAAAAQGGGKSDGGEKIRVGVRDELVYIL